MKYNLNKSNVYRTVRKIEKILIDSEEFKLPGKRILTKNTEESQIKTIVVDVTETEVERPKKKQKQNYSGKKKKHTRKSQIIIDEKNSQILCIAQGKGKKHDFNLFKNSKS